MQISWARPVTLLDRCGTCQDGSCWSFTITKPRTRVCRFYSYISVMALSILAVAIIITATSAATTSVPRASPTVFPGVTCLEGSMGVTLDFAKRQDCGYFTFHAFSCTGIRSFCSESQEEKHSTLDFYSRHDCNGLSRSFGSNKASDCKDMGEVLELTFSSLSSCVAWVDQSYACNSRRPSATTKRRPKTNVNHFQTE